MFKLFKKLLSKGVLEHEKRILQTEGSVENLQQIINIQQKHLNLISNNQIDMMKRLILLEDTFIKKLGIDEKVDKARITDILNLDESLKHLNSKIDYFTEDKNG